MSKHQNYRMSDSAPAYALIILALGIAGIIGVPVGLTYLFF